MPQARFILITLFFFSFLLQTNSVAANSLKVDINGFLRVDYSNGDRYPEAEGEDRLGVSKAALAVTAKGDDVEAVFVVGTELFTVDGGSDDGNVDIKDAFIVLHNVFVPGGKLKFGAQPLLFGLKPNGYPGDRSLQGSIEYGAGGAVAVSNQAGPAVIANIPFNKNFTLDFGLFDGSSPGAPTDTDGSSITNNFFVQLRVNDLDGLYAVAGYESVFLPTTRDNSAILDVGIGYKMGDFDASLEWISLESDITGTVEDEAYIVAEFSYTLPNKSMVYFDHSSASELDVNAMRLGIHHMHGKHVKLSAEISDESSDNPALESSSVDFRIELTY